jgi:hypothetical protein
MENQVLTFDFGLWVMFGFFAGIEALILGLMVWR